MVLHIFAISGCADLELSIACTFDNFVVLHFVVGAGDPDSFDVAALLSYMHELHA